MPNLIFPLPTPPLSPFWGDSQTAFNHNRTNPDGSHRRHAGVDLEARAGTPVIAMADGRVLRKAAFYEGTWVVEVQHPGFGIVRYGEVDPYGIMVITGQHIKQGDLIAVVGKRIGASRSMLHLELYANWNDCQVDPFTKGGHPLSVKNNKPYERRDDLVNPTAEVLSAPLASQRELTLRQDRNALSRQKLVAALRATTLANTSFDRPSSQSSLQPSLSSLSPDTIDKMASLPRPTIK